MIWYKMNVGILLVAFNIFNLTRGCNNANQDIDIQKEMDFWTTAIKFIQHHYEGSDNEHVPRLPHRNDWTSRPPTTTPTTSNGPTTASSTDSSTAAPGGLTTAGSLEKLVEGKECFCGGAVPDYPFPDNFTSGNQNVILTNSNNPPWQVHLVRKGEDSPFCVGSLISSRTILTAAECVVEDVRSMEIILLTEDLEDNAIISNRFGVESAYKHPNNSSNLDDYGVGVVQLKTNVVFSRRIFPICLPNTTESAYSENRTLYLSGFVNEINDTLQMKTMELSSMSNDECSGENKLYSAEYLTDRIICGYDVGGLDCVGQRGAPAVQMSEEGHYELAGVYLWREACQNSSAPGMYARVTAMLDWILNQREGTMCESKSPNKPSTLMALRDDSFGISSGLWLSPLHITVFIAIQFLLIL